VKALAAIFVSFVLSLVCAAATSTSPATGPASGLSADDTEYLRGVAADTWACLAHFVEPATGLPYDTSRRPEYTSVTNLGFYAASCAVAAELELVPADEAVARVRRVLEAYRRFKKWHGFSQSWNHVRTLEPAPHDTMISLLDSGNLIAGFMVAGQLLPPIRADVDEVLGALDWTPFYDPNDGRLFGGYDLARERFDTGWHIGDYAGDGRMIVFLAIANGGAPPAAWDKLGRETETHFGLENYRPAWLGGGLFMQVQTGLFLDERSMPAGRSAANFAYAQIVYAAHLGLPAWGWSACQAPDGRYLGWGGLEVPVVTPHAAALAALYYPQRATACLRELERRGARAPLQENGKEMRLGFRDSLDLRNGAVCDRYLPPLDQGMLLLALANVLSDGVVQRAFAASPIAQQGRQRIAEYARPADEAWLRELRRRDREPLPTVARAAASGPTRVVVVGGDVPDPARNQVGGENKTWTRDPGDTTVAMSLKAERDATRGRRCLGLDYDVDSPNPAFGGLTLNLNQADASGCNVLVLSLRGTPAKLKVEVHGRGGSGSIYIEGIRAAEWTEVVVPFINLGGMIVDWGGLDRIVLVCEDRISQPKTGTLWLDEVRFEARPTGGIGKP